jgi:hypothetical protein
MNTRCIHATKHVDRVLVQHNNCVPATALLTRVRACAAIALSLVAEVQSILMQVKIVAPMWSSLLSPTDSCRIPKES